jgi:hypothetical protein
MSPKLIEGWRSRIGSDVLTVTVNINIDSDSMYWVRTSTCCVVPRVWHSNTVKILDVLATHRRAVVPSVAQHTCQESIDVFGRNNIDKLWFQCGTAQIL